MLQAETDIDVLREGCRRQQEELEELQQSSDTLRRKLLQTESEKLGLEQRVRDLTRANLDLEMSQASANKVQDELQRHRVANRELYTALIAASSASTSANSGSGSAAQSHTPVHAKSPAYSSLLHQESAGWRRSPRGLGRDSASPPCIRGLTPPRLNGSSPPLPGGRLLRASPPRLFSQFARMESTGHAARNNDEAAWTGIKLLPEPASPPGLSAIHSNRDRDEDAQQQSLLGLAHTTRELSFPPPPARRRQHPDDEDYYDVQAQEPSHRSLSSSRAWPGTSSQQDVPERFGPFGRGVDLATADLATRVARVRCRRRHT
jgi:hypothetical protein